MLQLVDSLIYFIFLNFLELNILSTYIFHNKFIVSIAVERIIFYKYHELFLHIQQVNSTVAILHYIYYQ